MFLIAASSLPDDASESTDLRAYYTGNRRYFWFLVAPVQLGYVALGIYFVGPHLDFLFIQMIAPVFVAVILMAASWRWVHYAGLVLLFV